MRTLAKTGTYWLCHITVASGLAFALTGQWKAALAIGLLEPSVQAIVFLLHERAWESWAPKTSSSHTLSAHGAPL
jgi:uncharacterized membrane protein